MSKEISKECLNHQGNKYDNSLTLMQLSLMGWSLDTGCSGRMGISFSKLFPEKQSSFPLLKVLFLLMKKLSLNIFYIIRTSLYYLARGRATIGIFFLKTVPWKAKFFSPTVNQHWRYYFYWWKKLYFHFFVWSNFFLFVGVTYFFWRGKGLP